MTMAVSTVNRINCPACELGEGPYFDAETDTAWWFDILGCKLYEHHVLTGDTLIHDLPGMASAGARIDKDRHLLAMEDGLYLRTVADGTLDRIIALNEGRRDLRSNDGRVHPSGALWIGTMGKKAELGAGAIYWSDGQDMVTLFPDISIPNSICFSPDGATGYFADSPRGVVWRVRVDPDTGRPVSTPETFLTAADLPLGGGFDGSVVDHNGVLWNAAWGGGSVTGFAPDGSIVRTFEIPAAQVTCPCFIGPSLNRMLVTTAWEGYDETARARDPAAGHVFVIEGDFEGLAMPDFKLA